MWDSCWPACLGGRLLALSHTLPRPVDESPWRLCISLGCRATSPGYWRSSARHGTFSLAARTVVASPWLLRTWFRVESNTGLSLPAWAGSPQLVLISFLVQEVFQFLLLGNFISFLLIAPNTIAPWPVTNIGLVIFLSLNLLDDFCGCCKCHSSYRKLQFSKCTQSWNGFPPVPDNASIILQ